MVKCGQTVNRFYRCAPTTANRAADLHTTSRVLIALKSIILFLSVRFNNSNPTYDTLV